MRAADDREEKFYRVLAAMLKVPRGAISANASRETVAEWDSLRHMHLMLALEEEFGIEFDDGELADLSTVQTLLGAIAAKQGR